ncbi:hypothetical protein Ocin01_00250 [Orchesella cincta]|uniref:Uncharacterized protein n=1 Tax=Orchesella cincta TaxID=48709 RepID=A0A1D2NMD9_ORCCI|nr:hypothetical protein Ocin01_00250 [Orchesella cincta]
MAAINQSKRDSGASYDSDHSNLPAPVQHEVYFIIPRVVKVLYGPYMFRGMMDYRTDRLQGLKTVLEKVGVTVELKPSPDHVNLVRIWFLEEIVFSCKMTDLIHGGDGEFDPTCWEAAECLERFIRKVLKGLRKAQPEAEDLKRPFCPCFHVGDQALPTMAIPDFVRPKSRSIRKNSGQQQGRLSKQKRASSGQPA